MAELDQIMAQIFNRLARNKQAATDAVVKVIQAVSEGLFILQCGTDFLQLGGSLLPIYRLPLERCHLFSRDLACSSNLLRCLNSVMN